MGEGVCMVCDDALADLITLQVTRRVLVSNASVSQPLRQCACVCGGGCGVCVVVVVVGGAFEGVCV